MPPRTLATDLDQRRVSMPGLRSRWGAALVTPIERGGSSARVLRLQRGADDVVLKVLDDDDGVVDGHHRGAFRRKVRHHRWLLDQRVTAALYPAILDHGSEPGGEWLVVEHLDGQDLVDRVTAGDEPLPDHVDRLLETYADASTSWERPAPVAHWRTVHLDRLRRRLGYLRSIGYGDLVDAPTLVVNGRRHLGPACVVEHLGRGGRWEASIQPPCLRFPVHGDLNLRNVLCRDGGPTPRLAFIDPSGNIEPADPVYDLAKMLFSTTLFEPCLDGRLRCSFEPGGGVELRRHEASSITVDQLCESDAARSASGEADPDDLRRRLLFAHGAHALAESACRASLARSTASRSPAAVSLLVAGAALLDDWLAAFTGADDAAFERLGRIVE